MPTIEMSNDFFSGASAGFVSRVMNFNNTATVGAASTDMRSIAAVTGLLAGSNNAFVTRGTTQLYIMKGTVPTSFTGLTSYATRSADMLITYTTSFTDLSGSSPTANNFSPSVAGVNTHPVVLNTNYVFASASGIATWFWWVIRDVPANNNVLSNNLANQIIGTIGTPGTGNDLELPSTDIVAGQAYRVRNLILSFPQSWSW